jgi:hypothetical protein
MKKKIVIVLVLLCIALTSCDNNDSAKKKKDTPVVNETSAIESTEESTDTQEEIPASEEEVVIPDFLDFSDHTDKNESEYKTILGDLSKLRNGERFFAVKEPAANWKFNYSGTKDEILGYDMRSCDVSNIDIGKLDDNLISFNSDTIWPKVLPEGFEPDSILEYNKNPGIGIRGLHDRGINGSNIGIAIIDQGLLLEHEQYKDNLMYYERVHCLDKGAQMHGPAVASIAVGKTIGVAPGAKLYYIASTFGHYNNGNMDFDASIIADCILRVLEINDSLPENEKIRVISISRGYTREDKGYQELMDAIDKANDQNIFVVTASTEEYYHFNLSGMNRDYLKDPDDFNSYKPVGLIEKDFYDNPDNYVNGLMVPIGSRTYAACTGTEDYEIGHEGGMSWGVPWCAGFYAMCCQVKPDITPQEFINVATSTAVTIDLKHDDKTYKFGKIINPAEVIKQLESNQ